METIMITYNASFKNESEENGDTEALLLKRQQTLFDPMYPLLHTPSVITTENLFSILENTELPICNFDVDSLITSMAGIDVKQLLQESIDCTISIPFNQEAFTQDYIKFVLHNKIEFFYNITGFFTYNYQSKIQKVLKAILYAMQILNYAAFISDNADEIDSLIAMAREAVWLKVNQYNISSFGRPEIKDIDVVEYINEVISPYGFYPENTPFDNADEYIGFLTTPYIYKIYQLEDLPQIFDVNANLLYNSFLQNKLTGLCTYRADEIVRLYSVLQYITYLCISHVLEYTWELHSVSRFIYNHIYEDAADVVFIPESIKTRITVILQDKTLNQSSEADTMQTSNIALDKIDESYKSKMLSLQKIYIKVFKIGISKLMNKGSVKFFKKYYGRIPHLYKQYGNSSEVTENEMTDDPGEILQTGCVEYVERLSNEATALFSTLIGLARRLSSTTNVKEKIHTIKSYCTKFPIEDEENISTIKNNVISETISRIATSILQNNEIYGYTVEGIIENKKFPPSNHIVASLFVHNPHEVPESRSVTSIFKSEKSLLLFAHPQEILKFNNLYKTASSKILEGFNPKLAAATEKNFIKSTKAFQAQLQKNQTDSLAAEENEEDDVKGNKKMVKAIEKAVLESIDIVVAQKQRCLQCAGVAHDMIQRVTDLAKRCVVSMLETEKQHTDVRGNKAVYRTGNSLNGNKGIKKQLERNANHSTVSKEIQEKNRNRADTRSAF
jgi:hypothetical protein